MVTISIVQNKKGQKSKWSEVGIVDFFKKTGLVCCLIFYMAAVKGYCQPGPNLLQNPGFETYGIPIPNWSISGTNPNAYQWEYFNHSGKYSMAEWSSSNYQIYIYQTINGLRNGVYTFRAHVYGSGGQNAAYMNAKDYGGNEMRINIPTQNYWVQISLTNIVITNHNCTIGFYSDAHAENWISFDDAEFFLQDDDMTPNYIKKQVFFNNDSIQTTTSYLDGLNKPIRTQVDLGNYWQRIAGTEYNYLGKPWRTTLPFKEFIRGFWDDNPVTSACNDRGTYAYSETILKKDPLQRADSIGAPGPDFAVTGTHFGRSWNFGTALSAGGNIDATGFLIENSSVLNNGNLDALEDQTLTSTPTCFLTVSKSANDNSYTQEIKDVFGNKRYTCSMRNILAAYDYDVANHLIKEVPPATDGSRQLDIAMAATTTYDSRGLVTSRRSPDAGLVEYLYDDAGQLRLSQNQKQRDYYGEYLYTVYFYDDLGRNYAIGTTKRNNSRKFHQQDVSSGLNGWSTSDVDLCIQKFYDNSELLFAALKTNDIELRYCPLENTQGRLIGEICYQSKISDPAVTGFWDNVTVDIYSYDVEGNIIAKIKRCPDMDDFAMFSYKFDNQGNPIKYVFEKNENYATPNMDNLTFTLDRQGRTQKISSSGVSFLANSYDEYGRLIRKNFSNNFNTTPSVEGVSWTYNIRDWVSSIRSDDGIFSEENITYNEPAIAGQNIIQKQYNGNISAVQYRYDKSTTSKPVVQYCYDEVNRLTNVSSTDDPVNFPIEQLSYKSNGRIATKQRGSDPTGTYTYNTNTNQLNTIAGHLTKSHSNNYLYDPNGNMVLDYSKKMFVIYDFRDLPIKFKFFDNIPQSALTAYDPTRWNELESLITDPKVADKGALVSEVDMFYDVSGNRVAKLEYK